MGDDNDGDDKDDDRQMEWVVTVLVSHGHIAHPMKFELMFFACSLHILLSLGAAGEEGNSESS